MNFGTGRSSYAGGVAPPLRPAANSLDARAYGDRMFQYVYDDFRYVDAMALGGGAAAGTTGQVNKLFTGNLFNMPYEYAIIGAGQTIIVPVLINDGTLGQGINIGLDQTATEGLEMIFGAQHAGVTWGRLAFTSRSAKPFFAKVKLAIEDISGAQVYFGWKKAGAFDATFANYTDFAMLGMGVSSQDGVVYSQTQLNTGGVTATATQNTWADNGVHTLAVAVDGDGYASYYYDGVKQRTPPSFRFDAGDVLVPILRHTNLTDVAGKVIVREFEAGFVAPQGL